MKVLQFDLNFHSYIIFLYAQMGGSSLGAECIAVLKEKVTSWLCWFLDVDCYKKISL